MSAALADVVTLTPLPTDHWRPSTRGECPAERPCPYVGCRHHLYLEVGPTGEVRLNWPDHEPDEIPESCALDVAERGGASLQEVARAFDLTRQRIQQIEIKALAKAKKQLQRRGLRPAHLIPDLEAWQEDDEPRRRRPSPTEAAGMQWFGEPADESEAAEAGRLFWDPMRPRVQREPEADSGPAGEEDNDCDEQEAKMQDPSKASETPPTCQFFHCTRPVMPRSGPGARWTSYCEEHSRPNARRSSERERRAWERAQQAEPAAQAEATTPTLCPCGCGREVTPGRQFASRGCPGRMRFRGVGNPRLKKTAAVPEPAAAPNVAAPKTSDADAPAEELREAPIPVIADLCPRCHHLKLRPGDGSSRHPHWSCVSCGYTHDIPMGPQGAEWMPTVVQEQLATVREEAGQLTERLERGEASLRQWAKVGQDLGSDKAALEEEAEKLRASLAKIVEVLDLGPGAPLDAILRRVEILRWHAGEAPEDAQSPDGSPLIVATWPDVCERVGLITVDRPMPTWTEYCSRAAHLLAIERGEQEGEPVDLVALPHPEDLPAAWLFRYVRYGLAEVEKMVDSVDRISR